MRWALATPRWCDAAGALVGFALWQSTPLAAGRPRDEQRVLKLVATDAAAFERLIDGLQADAIASRLRRIAVRCQTAFSEAYTHLAGRGFRVHWTDLRMTLPEAPEPEVDGRADVELGDLGGAEHHPAHDEQYAQRIESIGHSARHLSHEDQEHPRNQGDERRRSSDSFGVMDSASCVDGLRNVS